MPPAVQAWFSGVITRSVLIEFDRFIAAGHLATTVANLGNVESVGSISGFAGMNL